MKKTAILGFGMEGKDSLDYFLAKGYSVSIFDKKKKSELDFEGVPESKVGLFLGKDYDLKFLTNFDSVVRSPGVYRYLPKIVEAEKKGVEITSAIKIFFSQAKGKIIGVTGTKGKGTTASLIYRILKDAGKDVYLAGNIGIPYLSLLPKLKKNTVVVLEMSSFQLIDMEVSPQISVVLNITSDHLDWHKDLKEYVEAKKRVVRFQRPEDYAVINADYETSRSFAAETKAQTVLFSKNKLAAKYKDVLILRGEHNWENVAAAVSVAKIFKVKDEIILQVLGAFRGLEHRLELVGEVRGVTFCNDSFATGPQPTIAAVNSFTEPLTVILGGYDKKLDYGQLGQVISQKKNVVNVILLGAVAGKIKQALKGASFAGKMVEMGKPEMAAVVQKAFSLTPKGGVVLLSPAAASFDMFPNYKERGKKFKEAVLALKQ
ncbi:MAG: UDP-N-acetylmuramoyl-L-alanine--D-glutamate ligase [Patescibacteria group bacterium]